MPVIIENDQDVHHWFAYVKLHDYRNILPDGTYYYVDINPGTEIDIAKNRHAADNVLGTDKILLLDNMLEGFAHNIPWIYEHIVIRKNIPENQILLMSGCADIEQLVNDVAKKYNRKPIKSQWVLFWANSLMNDVLFQKRYLRDTSYLEKQYEYRINNYKKIYLNLNRRWRAHRISMTALLEYKNLLDKGYVSLTTADDGFNISNFNYQALLEEHINDSESLDILKIQQNNMHSFTNLYIDRQTMIDNEAHLSNDIEPYYWDTAINLTSETNFYTSLKHLHTSGRPANEPTRFFSEKVFKPMLYLQPFILICVPKSLKLLHELGFKTFHPYIDESYDDELDDSLRMKKILKEVEKFCNYSPIELREFLIQVKDICLHNSKQLFLITKRL
jgi:hypothetical protein